MNHLNLRVAFLFTILAGLTPHLVEAQTLVRGPYLQMGSGTATTVRWRTSTATDSVVRYGFTVTNLDLVVTDSTSTTEHELRLTGLTPNTTYYYSVGSTTTTLAQGSDCFVVTAPAGTKPTRIWVLGDPGTGSSVQTTVRDAYYAFTGTRHTDLWLMLGDNAYSSGTDAEYTSKLFNIYPTMLRRSVLWPTLGNHDAASADSLTQTGVYYDSFTLPRQGEAGGLASGTEAYYSFDYGNTHFVCLDSQETDRSAGGAMATWLAQDLQNNLKDWLIVFFHHPPYSKGSHNSDTETQLIEMRQNFLPILENYGVDLVLCGHSHSYERSQFIDGHYGNSSTFSSAMVKQSGGGQGAGAYTKANPGPAPHAGAVYAVPGASGQTSGGTLNHPAMYISLNVAGSMVLDLNGNRLDATYLDSTGAVRDTFTMLKGVTPNSPPSVAITSPANGSSYVAPANITIDATASDADGTITRVDFYQGTTLLGSDLTSPYSFDWIGAPAGIYSLTAHATDNLGAVTTSAPISITVNPNSQSTIVALQQGSNNYSGMTDTTIRSNASSTNYGSDVTLLVDGDPADFATLLRWDLSVIPAGKTITGVTLTFNVVDASAHAYELYALKRSWSESAATWVRYSSGNAKWQTPGANGANDRDFTPVGTLSASATGSATVTLNSTGVAKVQSWLNSPSTNFGFIIQNATNIDGIDFTSSEGATVSQRPVMTITYQ
jgi:acid phosphatase type 7